MKTKLLIALFVAVLFSGVTAVVYSTAGSGNSVTESVKICPNTGLPCDGDGLCGSGNGQPCGGGDDCCTTQEKKVAPSEKSACGGCDGCPSKTAGGCPGKMNQTNQTNP